MRAVAENLTEAQKRAYILADNRLAMNAGWDEEMLAVELSDLQADAFEKGMFAELVEQEDPDLLDWFMEVSEPPRPELKTFIQKLKHYIHG